MGEAFAELVAALSKIDQAINAAEQQALVDWQAARKRFEDKLQARVAKVAAAEAREDATADAKPEVPTS